MSSSGAALDGTSGLISCAAGGLLGCATSAIGFALNLASIDPLSYLESAFAGRPKYADTQAVITAYKYSAYWPLHSLASNLTIAMKNGAPISSSSSTVQAQFSNWKAGTAHSICQSPDQGACFWTILNLINASWAASGNGASAVVGFVRAMDRIYINRSQNLTWDGHSPYTQPVTQPVTTPIPYKQCIISIDGIKYTSMANCFPIGQFQWPTNLQPGTHTAVIGTYSQGPNSVLLSTQTLTKTIPKPVPTGTTTGGQTGGTTSTGTGTGTTTGTQPIPWFQCLISLDGVKQ